MVDQSECRGVVNRVEAEAGPGAGPLVVSPEPGQVEVGEHITVEGKEGVVEQVFGELDAAGGAARIRLGQITQPRSTGFTLAEHGFELVGEETTGENDVIDTVVGKPFDHE